MNNIKFLLIGFGLIFSYFAVGQGHSIDFKVKNYDNDTLLVGFYYGDRQLVHDTLFATSKGKFKLSGEERIDGGMYLLLFKPANNILQFLVPENDQEFSLECDAKDPSTATVKGSQDNEAFYSYLDFIAEKRKAADPIREKLKAQEEAGGEKDSKLQSQLNAIDKEVNDFRDIVIAENPNTLTRLLLKSNVEIDIPEFEGTEEEIQIARYRYYKKHFFDNVDFAYPSLIRTPFFYEKVLNYIDKLTPQAPDSIIQSIDYILELTKDNDDAHKFCLSGILNKFAKNKFIGMDAIYVHMIDKYYSQGQADWVDQENLDKMIENANNLRPILIGKTFPNITLYKENEEPLMVHNVDSKYTMVIFWAPDCGHCKKSMPSVVEFYEKWKDKGLKVVSVCTKGGDKFPDCWKFIEEKGMTGFINTGDKYQRYRKYVYIPSTPKIFILDKDKKILIKDIPSEELDKIMEEIVKDEKEQE